jgi:ketosteroid isomerase-like protein
MSDLQAIADRFEIEALRGEYTDAAMMRDYDRLASLFTQDGAARVPHLNAEAVGREAIRAGICYAGHLLMENRNALIVDIEPTQADAARPA